MNDFFVFFQVSLQLYSAGLTTLQPGALGLMPNLEDLHLENNNITLIDTDTFANCSNLQNLFLENNNIKVNNCHVAQLNKATIKLGFVLKNNEWVAMGSVMSC